MQRFIIALTISIAIATPAHGNEQVAFTQCCVKKP